MTEAEEMYMCIDDIQRRKRAFHLLRWKAEDDFQASPNLISDCTANSIQPPSLLVSSVSDGIIPD